MKRITKKNILKYIELKKEYKKTQDQETLKNINEFTENVINKDKKYYTKISSYNINKEDLKYLL